MITINVLFLCRIIRVFLILKLNALIAENKISFLKRFINNYLNRKFYNKYCYFIFIFLLENDIEDEHKEFSQKYEYFEMISKSKSLTIISDLQKSSNYKQSAQNSPNKEFELNDSHLKFGDKSERLSIDKKEAYLITQIELQRKEIVKLYENIASLQKQLENKNNYEFKRKNENLAPSSIESHLKYFSDNDNSKMTFRNQDLVQITSKNSIEDSDISVSSGIEQTIIHKKWFAREKYVEIFGKIKLSFERCEPDNFIENFNSIQIKGELCNIMNEPIKNVQLNFTKNES